VFEIQSYPTFLAAILAFQLAPGAGTLVIVNAAARGGRSAGLGAVAGTLAGDLVYMTGAVLGVAALMQAHPMIFHGLQWFGAAYLCWLGLQMVRAPAANAAGGSECPSGRRYFFRQALLVCLTNPKALLFFFAFFPLFMSPDAPAATLLAMIAHVTVLSLVYQLLLVFAGHTAARRLAAMPALRVLAARAAGVALIAFGLKLAAANR